MTQDTRMILVADIRKTISLHLVMKLIANSKENLIPADHMRTRQVLNSQIESLSEIFFLEYEFFWLRFKYHFISLNR